ncbi:MAG: hypothetical protein IJ444_01975 [Kiritimatiellae bacterium]|nr:hypothetical protein [Kiritimatiellia bacterium]
MAKYNLENYLEKDGLGFPLNFRRGNPNPLDNSSVWATLEAAQNYAATDPVAYVGQILSVVDNENGKVDVYSIQDEAGNLKKVGTSPVGDEGTITVAEDGTVSLYGVAGLELTRTEDDGSIVNITYQPLYVNGKLTWVEPSATTVEGLAAEIESLKTRISALETAVGDEESGLVKGVADLEARMDAAEGDVDAINTKIGEVAADKTVVQMIADAQAAATYDDTELAGRVTAIESDYLKNADKTALETAISDGDAQALEDAKAYADGLNSGVVDRVAAIEGDYLKNADKTELSNAISAAEESAVDRVLGYLAEEEVNASYDTLKEVAAWIESDTTASAELVTRVSNIEKDYLKSADKTALQGEIDALETLVGTLPEGATSDTVVAYIQEVVDGLKIGDYAKLADLNALIERVVTLEDKAHEHANKDVIDGITAEKVAAWDAAEQNAKDYADTGLAGKVAVETGKSLIADTLIEKLEGIEAGAQANKVETVDETYFGLTDKHLTLLDITMDKVTGLQDALDGKANNGTTLAEYGITDAYTKTETLDKIAEKITEINGGESAGEVLGQLNSYKETNDARVLAAETAIAGKVDAVEGKGLSTNDLTDDLLAKLNESQANVIESVSVAGTLLEVVEKKVEIPVATADAYGVVKSSADENKVAVAEDGTMEVNSLNANKLVQTDGEYLIMNGGSAALQ